MLEQALSSVSQYTSEIASISGIKLTRKQHAFVAKLITGMCLLGSFKITKISAFF